MEFKAIRFGRGDGCFCGTDRSLSRVQIFDNEATTGFPGGSGKSEQKKMTHRQTRRIDLILLPPRDGEDVRLVLGRACPSRDRETGRSLELRAFKDVSAVNDFSGRSRGKEDDQLVARNIPKSLGQVPD